MSTYAIGALVGRDPKRIHEKLVDFGISRRPKWHRIATDAHISKNAPRRGWKHTEEARQKCIAAASKPHPSMRGSGNPMYGKRGEAHHNWKGGGTPERQRIYASAEWAALVQCVYARDGFRCRRCATPKQQMSRRRSSLRAHHVKSWASCVEGRMDRGNIVTLCAACHRWVHSKKNVERLFLG